MSDIKPLQNIKRPKAKQIISSMLSNKFMRHRTKTIENEKKPKSLSAINNDEIFSPQTDTRLHINNFLNIEEHKLSSMSTRIKEMLINEIEGSETCELENGRKTKLLFEKFNILEISEAILLLMGLCLAIIAYDIDFETEQGKPQLSLAIDINETTLLKQLLLSLVFILTIFLIPIVCARYYMKLKWLQERKEISRQKSIFNKPYIWYLLMELGIILIIPTPFFLDMQISNYNDVVGIHTFYSLNDIFSLIMLFRIFLFFRVFITYTHYYGNSAHRICKLYGCENNYLFVFKCIMKYHPLEMILGTMAILIFVFGYALKLCERPLVAAIKLKIIENSTNEEYKLDLGNYYNAIWCIIVTMTTVGYGDYYPKTLPGRAIGFFMCIYGVISVSLMVLTLENILKMTFFESRAFQNKQRVDLIIKNRKDGGYALFYIAKINYIMNHPSEKNIKICKKYIIQLKYYLNRIKDTNRKLLLFQNKLSFAEEISKQFNFFQQDILQAQEKVILLAELHNLLLESDNNLPISKTEEKHNSPKLKDNIIEKSFSESSSSNYNESFIKEKENLKERKSIKKSLLNQFPHKTPLLTQLMREKRKSEYKLNTEYLSFGSSFKKKTEKDPAKPVQQFLSQRKSQYFNNSGKPIKNIEEKK